MGNPGDPTGHPDFLFNKADKTRHTGGQSPGVIHRWAMYASIVALMSVPTTSRRGTELETRKAMASPMTARPSVTASTFQKTSGTNSRPYMAMRSP